MKLTAAKSIPEPYRKTIEVSLLAWESEPSEQDDYWHGDESLDVNIWQDEEDGGWHIAVYPVVDGRTDACRVLFSSQLALQEQ